MNVFLTVDVETYTGDYALDVNGYGKGLPFILDMCNRYEIKATFFVEALGATRWGINPLREICSQIKKADHDIQLHLHPKVAKIQGIDNNDDRLWAYDKKTQKRFIAVGLKILEDCGVKNVSSLRAGDLAANQDTLSAMEELGLFLSSNRDLDKKSSIYSKINDFFSIRNDLSKCGNIYDLPLTAFRSSMPLLDGPYRHFEICALGLLEMTDALSRMLRAGYSCATILTHPGEFFYRSGNGTAFIRKDCCRFEKLLKFLKGRDDMITLTISECIDNSIIHGASRPEIKLNPLYSVMRVCAQIIDRKLREIR